jgi:hypothetical protein
MSVFGKYNRHRRPSSPAMIRDYAGIIVCAMIVFASISLGFVQVIVKVLLGVEATFDASWSANLSAMASMALGALIQKNVGPSVNSLGGAGNNANVTVTTPYTPPPIPEGQTNPGICPCCGQPIGATDANTGGGGRGMAPE